MAIRTDSDLVLGILLDEYGPRRDGTLPAIDPFIATASILVDRVAARGASLGYNASEAELELIERWLAAHFYKCAPDQAYASNRTMEAQAVYQGRTDMALNSTKFGQTAITLDGSGSLAVFSKGRGGRIDWVGSTPVPPDPYGDTYTYW